MSQTAHTPESGLAEATAALASAMSGGTASPAAAPATPAPAPEPVAAPAPAPVTETTGIPFAAPPAPPASTATPPAPPATTAEPGTPGATATVPEIADPAARRYLEMTGGDVNKALAKALRDNNRLAELYRVSPELFRNGAPADPNQAPSLERPLFEEPPSVTPPEIVYDPVAIQNEVNARVYADPQSTQLIRDFMAEQQQLQGLNAEVGKLQREQAYLEMKLSDPDFGPDDLRRGEIEGKLSRIQQQQGLLEGKIFRLETKTERLDSTFRQRRAQIQESVEGEFYRQAEEQAYTEAARAIESDEYARIMAEWPVALSRCVTENNIPQELLGDFRADALREFQAALADQSMVISDLYSFLAPRAKQIAARLDRYHRVQASRYATGAAVRAATPSPPTTPGTPAPPVAQNKTPEEAMAEATRYWRQRTSARA